MFFYKPKNGGSYMIFKVWSRRVIVSFPLTTFFGDVYIMLVNDGSSSIQTQNILKFIALRAISRIIVTKTFGFSRKLKQMPNSASDSVAAKKKKKNTFGRTLIVTSPEEFLITSTFRCLQYFWQRRSLGWCSTFVIFYRHYKLFWFFHTFNAFDIANALYAAKHLVFLKI